jgi:lon-related putative ATP-dependent protease
MKKAKRLRPEELYWRCSLDKFDFETTDELEELTEIIGQPRVIEAMRFGINMEQQGYNIFAVGLNGTGKRTLVRRLFAEKAADQPVPVEWCYVNNFEQPHKPRALPLSPGKGNVFKQEMEELVEELQTALSGAFESDEYQARRQKIEEEFQEHQENAFEETRRKAQTRDLTLLRTSSGLIFAPIRDGEILSPEELQNLSEEQRKELEDKAVGLQEELQKNLRQFPRWQREMREKVKAVNREFADLAVGGLINELREKYSEQAEVQEYLDDVQQDIIENSGKFVGREDGQQTPAISQEQNNGLPLPGPHAETEAPFLRRYQVNVLVDHGASKGSPVIYEDNPTYANLMGRVEHVARLGALMTDFNLIKPGALHRANGGYLMLEARKMLLEPFAWEGLKRALWSEQLRLESPGQMYSLISTVSLEPEPIPLKVKVALMGEPLLYYLLSAYDPEFGELFKVIADFDERMDRDRDHQLLYARLIASIVHKNELRPFDRSAVARVIEQSARLVGDSEKLSAQIRDIANLLREADYWAGQTGHEVVTKTDVQQAIEAQIYRSDRIRERMQEQIKREMILIDTEGSKVGQINALSVIQLSNDFTFGRPSRITARVRLGEGQVIDIEREVELGGALHSKGVLILSGFLGARYAREHPLSLSASLVFEQSYGGIEGDSASSAELYALLSAIAEAPIRQSLAVTGSVNQHGQIQAIGGVNEKIEGFFDVCQAKGLNGEQGVLIPAANMKHLMLRQDVIEAVSEEKFHICAVETVDQGLELLTGMPAGEADEEGNYPEESFNGRVQMQLAELARKRLEFSRPNEAGKI